MDFKFIQALTDVFTAKVIPRRKNKYVAIFLLLWGVYFLWYKSAYFSPSAVKYFISSKHLEHSNAPLLIIPAYLSKGSDGRTIHEVLNSTPLRGDKFQVFSPDHLKIYPEGTLLIHDYSSVFGSFEEQKTHIYNSAMDISQKPDKCADLESDLKYSVSSQKEISTPIEDIVRNILKALDNGDAYVKSIENYFRDKVRLQLKHKVTPYFWFRLAGTSVWLKEYGLHLMVSRVIYTDRREKNRPNFSIAYAQLFTDDWAEVSASLLVPTNLGQESLNNAINIEGDNYVKMSFPTVLPVPFPVDTSRKYQGPEDPRIFLVKNRKGYEEPLIIFNQHHTQKLVEIVDGVEQEKSKDHRNMWISWLWQFQLGKENVQSNSQSEFGDMIFNRANELLVKGGRLEEKTKNWSPMTSLRLRDHYGYDGSIFVSTRYPNLEILKCDISGKISNCEYMTLDDNPLLQAEVGPLRGGTAMININQIIAEQTDISMEKIIKKGREIWVGIARAHFDKCGCGDAFYRPNVVVITLDQLTCPDNKIRQIFSLSHVSGFMGLNVDITPWIPDLNVCHGRNILIPNGIGYWKIGNFRKSRERDEWMVDDMLTLSISISDMSVGVVKIKGLLESLVRMSPNSPFEKYEGDHKEPLDGDPIGTEDHDWSASLKKFGASDDHIMCALKDSERFCRVYGESQGFSQQDWEENKFEDPTLEETEALKDYKAEYEASKN